MLICKSSETGVMIDPIIITDNSFNDFLLYCTSQSDLIICSIPQLDITYRFRVTSNPLNNPILFIKCFDIIDDYRNAYLWLINNQNLTMIKDYAIVNDQNTTFFQMGFGFTD